MLASRAEPMYLDGDNRVEIERYVLARGLVRDDGLPIAVERAGAGNMNLALRVTPAGGCSFIVKQGRSWVEKYPQIPAPFERTLVEAAFYAAAQTDPRVAAFMPAVLHLDRDNHVLVLEDVAGDGDFASIYTGHTMPTADLNALLEWLEHLVAIKVPDERRAIFANRAMRALNHEHMFSFPLNEANGLELDGITPGLGEAARELARDRRYCAAAAALGKRYLADGETLVHGDYFPGSWLKAPDGVRIIDPEFCFLGDPEFDCGILAAHLVIARCDAIALERTTANARRRRLDLALVAGYAGVEIMRRLIGVAQLPLSDGLDWKRALLERSRRLVLEPHRGLQ
ncbi:MAG: phosphotransferase [Vicinamibacterales bacterium]